MKLSQPSGINDPSSASKWSKCGWLKAGPRIWVSQLYSSSSLLTGVERMLSYNLGDEVIRKYLDAGLGKQYNEWTADRINQRLREMDERNGSFTDQDPSSYAAYARTLSADSPTAEQPTATLLFTPPAPAAPLRMVCALRELTSKTQCSVRSGDDLWVIKAKANGDVPLEKIRFDLGCNPAGHMSQQRSYQDCMLQVL